MKHRFTFQNGPVDTSDSTTRKLINITSSLVTASVMNEYGSFDEELVNQWGRGIGGVIYDITPKYSGYTSIAALMYQYKEVVINGKKLGDTVKLTPEHFHPRQVAGVELVKWALTVPNFGLGMIDAVQEKINTVNTVHYVLPNENIKLRDYQKVGEFSSWETSYTEAGIELVKWDRRTKVKNLFEVHPSLEPRLEHFYS